MYRVHLSEEQQAELRRRASSRETAPRTRDRLERVRLADAGWSIPRIARLLHKSEEQVRYWVKRFLVGGFDALPDAPHLGQQSALTPAILASVRERLRQSDRTWRAQEVADWIAEKHGVRRSADRVRRAMRAAGFSYKRTHRHLRQKQRPEEVAKKRQELAELEKKGIRERLTCATSTKPALRRRCRRLTPGPRWGNGWACRTRRRRAGG